MRKKNTNNNKSRWSAEDRQNFADRNILKAQTIQGRRFGGPEADEWDDDDLWDD